MLAGLLAAALQGLAPVPAEAADRSTLSVGVSSDPVTLDPALMASFFETTIQYDLFEPLLHQRPDLSIEPGLASVDVRDPLHYDFTLREGLTFHDGTPVDAEAARFSLERLLDPATGSPRRAELEPVERIDVTGARTFTVTLKRPFAPFLQLMALRAGLLVSPSAVRREGAAFASRPVGAGPYKIVRWTKNAELELERFDGYWRGPAAIPRVVFRPFPDDTVRLTNLRANSVQLIDSLPPQSVEEVSRQPGFVVKNGPGLGFMAFSFNTTRPPFSDGRLRRAFTLAVDRDVIRRVAYANTGTVAFGGIPPLAAWAYDPQFRPMQPDADAARRMIGETGMALPIPVAVTIPNSPVLVRIAEILQAQVGQVGFRVEIRRIDFSSLISVLRQRDFDLASSPWSGRSDPDGNLFTYFTASGPNNFAGYRSQEVTELLEQARQELDQGRRAQLYRRVETVVAGDAPMLFVMFPAMIQASSADLEWTAYPDGALHLQFARWRKP
ncbi:MAG: ABC transporter substrate-binding protein [Alsobacter sp.]